jgi:hypothetical protein
VLGLYVASIVTMGALAGFLLAPGRALTAWRAASGDRPSLFVADAPSYDEILALTVGELRAHLGVPREGLVGARSLHARAPRPRVARG